MTPQPSQPDDPLIRRVPVFYGWVILGVGLGGMVMTSPGQTYAVSIFIEPIIEDLSISRSLVSSLYTMGTLVGSLVLPLMGRLIDRRGPRFVITVVALIFGLACVYMGFVANAVMLAFGFVAIRMFGQGSLMLASQNLINRWWIARRGLVMGIAGMAMSVIGLGGFPNLIHWLIGAFDWHTAYFVLGGLVLGLMVPLGFVFARNRPEDHGLNPDGRATDPSDTADADDDTPLGASPREVNWTLDEAIRTGAFWVVALGVAVKAMLSTGLTFHIVSIFQDNGLTADAAAATFVPIAVTTALVNLSSGALADHIQPRFLLVIALAFQAVSLLMATHLTSIAVAIAYGATLGITDGLTRTVNSMIWATYFGRAHLGSITGITSTVVIFGSALGPMPFGIARDLMGSYETVLAFSAVIPVGLGLANLWVRRPIKETEGAAPRDG